MKIEEQLQFEVESKALKRKIRTNKNSRRFSIFVLVVMWVVSVLDVIRAFTMPGGDLTMKHIAAQNDIQFQLLFTYIYTLWCSYSIPKGAEECQSAINAFTKKWANLFEEDEVPEETPEEDTKETVRIRYEFY